MIAAYIMAILAGPMMAYGVVLVARIWDRNQIRDLTAPKLPKFLAVTMLFGGGLLWIGSILITLFGFW